MHNPFYETAVNHMAIQLAYIEKAIGRSLTDEEKDNIHELFEGLDQQIKDDFESKLGGLL